MAKLPPLTAAEKAKLAWITARVAKRSLAGDDVDMGDLERRWDRIVEGARKRQQHNPS